MKREIKYLLESWLQAKNSNGLNKSTNNPMGNKGGPSISQTQNAIILKYQQSCSSDDPGSMLDNDEFGQDDEGSYCQM